MHSDNQRSEFSPERRGAGRVDQSDAPAREPWVAPEIEELPPLTEVVLDSPIEGGGGVGDNPF